MHSPRCGLPRFGLAAFAGLAFGAATEAPAFAQAVDCSGINTMIPHDENHESSLFDACEQLQGTAAVESAAHAAIAPRALSAAVGALRGQSDAVTGAISDRIRELSRDLAQSLGPAPAAGARYSGMSAGSPDSRWSLWGDASGSFLHDSAAIGYDGTSVVALTGADYILDRKWVLGFSTGYTHADLNLKSVATDRESDGGVVGPYAAYVINPHLSVDAQFNYTGLSNTLTSGLVGSNEAFSGSRLTGAANLNAYADRGPWKLTGIGGYAYSWEGSDRNYLSAVPPFSNNIRYGALKLGGEAGYMLQPQLEAYAPLRLEVETTAPRDGTGRVALVFGAGLRYQWSDRIKLGFMVTTAQLKTNWQDVLIGANLRIGF